jgi:hypothetical protein
MGTGWKALSGPQCRSDAARQQWRAQRKARRNLVVLEPTVAKFDGVSRP